MKQDIVLGGGCFWCIEAIFKSLKGIEYIKPGFSGGNLNDPTYKQVCEGNTGHIEVVYITFEDTIISLSDVLDIFFLSHNPSSLDKQGEDIGYQYKSIIFVFTDKQRQIVEDKIIEIENRDGINIVTEIRDFEIFYKAGIEHDDYYNLNKDKNPYCQAVITPKLEKIKKEIQKRNLN